MKKILLQLSLICLFMANEAIVKAAGPLCPVMTFSTKVIDKGSIPEGPDYKYIFRFRNTGDAALKILNVSTPCSCTSPDWSRKSIAPGDSGEVDITFHSNGRNGDFLKTCAVVTNMGEDKDLFITIKGVVISKGYDISFTRNDIDMYSIPEGPDYKYYFPFKNTGNTPLKITDVKTPCSCTTPSWTKEPIQPGDSGHVTISYHSLGQTGPFRKTCTVQINNNHVAVEYLTIGGYVISVKNPGKK